MVQQSIESARVVRIRSRLLGASKSGTGPRIARSRRSPAPRAPYAACIRRRRESLPGTLPRRHSRFAVDGAAIRIRLDRRGWRGSGSARLAGPGRVPTGERGRKPSLNPRVENPACLRAVVFRQRSNWPGRSKSAWAARMPDSVRSSTKLCADIVTTAARLHAA
jgi:hypothetical protein